MYLKLIRYISDVHIKYERICNNYTTRNQTPLDAKQLGRRKIYKEGIHNGTMAQYKGKPSHDNKWEEG